MQVHFTAIDWGVLAAYLLFTTWLGARLAGRTATIREFFLADRKIPWLAVAGSSIATEISAVTLISVPAIVYKSGGNLTYLQLMFGAVFARVIIAIWFIPAFYEREIFSPYDYMARWFGPNIRLLTTGLFVLGAVLGQSVRVLLTAIVLELISGIPLSLSIWIIGLAAVIWTLLGGITTVIWTDVIQFFVFLCGIVVALVIVVTHVPGGVPEILRLAMTADPAGNKLQLLNPGDAAGDWYQTLNQPYTIWAGLLANTVICLAAYGTDQMMAQRIFCCRGVQAARYATLASCGSLVFAVLAALVGLGLFAFYHHFPLAGEAAAQVAAANDRIFPVFLVQEVPVGLTGLIIAGVFAAAISTLDSVLVALSQVIVTGVVQPWRATWRGPREGDERRDLLLSKLLVVAWAALLCATAQVAVLALEHYRNILDLALAMATYTGGPMLAAFLLALWRVRVDGAGLLWAAPLAVLVVFSLVWHAPWAQMTTLIAAGVLLAGWLLSRRLPSAHPVVHPALQTGLVLLALGLALFLSRFTIGSGEAAHPITLAWPWNVPVGFLVALPLGYLLASRREETQNDAT